MTKILFIAANDWANWGGSELLWSGAAEKLARQGFQIRVSMRDWGEPIRRLDVLESAGCQVFRRRPPSFLYRMSRKFLPLPEYTKDHIRKAGAGVDLVVISQGGSLDGLPWMEAAKSAGLKYVVIAQGAADFHWPEDSHAERLAAGYEGASRAYFVSQAILDLSRRQFATPLARGRVVRNPFNVRYEANPAWPTTPDDRLLIASVGRLDVDTKGQDLLLEVMSLPHWRERNTRVSLVGKGINERVLRYRAEQLKLANLNFLGFQGDIEDVWAKHHALVLPSRQEGMPLALVEAMLCGRPGIVTDIGGSRELLRDGVNGFLAKAPTVQAIDEAMTRAWQNRNELAGMGKVAARDVRQWISADPCGDFAGELIDSIDQSETK